MTAKTKLREDFQVEPKWTNRLTNHEAENLVIDLSAREQRGEFTRHSPSCKRVAFQRTLTTLTHRGVPADKR